MVREAWSAVLDAPHDDRLNWAEAGGDSLRTLQLQHRLETALGRKLSFNLFDATMTASSLADDLDADARPVPAEAPVVFLVPGLGGDEPVLADFRRAFGDRIRFETVDAPGVDAPAVVLNDMVITGSVVGGMIADRAPKGALVVAGWSFGGMVAFEAARNLAAQGRTIALVVLLDTYVPSEMKAGRAPSAPAPRPRLWRFLSPGYWRSGAFVDGLLRRVAPFDGLRHGTLGMARALGRDAQFNVERYLRQFFRGRAMETWRPEPLDLPVLLFLSDQNAHVMRDWWSARCPQLTVVRTPGKHLELLRPGSLEVVTPAFEAAVKAALT